MKTSHTAEMGPQTKSIPRSRILITALLGSILLAYSVASAKEKNNQDIAEFQLPSYNVEAFGLDLKPPDPVKVVVPPVGMNLVGTEVTMIFQVSKDGYVGHIRHKALVGDENGLNLASIMKSYLRTWRFDPALDKAGNAVAVKMKLPVKVVSSGAGKAGSYAKLTANQPTIVAVASR